MFQEKINEIFKGLPKVFPDDISIVECESDGRDHDKTLR